MSRCDTAWPDGHAIRSAVVTVSSPVSGLRSATYSPFYGRF